MNKLESWLSLQKKKSDRIISLEETLLGGNFLNYAYYRLRFFSFRVFVHLALRLLEVKIFLLLLPASTVYAFLIGRILLVSVNAFWWGLLEGLREKVRQLAHAKKLFKIPALISQWMGSSFALSVIGLICLVTFNLFQFKTFLKLETVYLSFCFIRLMLEIPLATFHSGIYAIRRIYRPLYWIIIVELISSLGVFALYPFLGVWAFPITFFISTLLNLSVRFFYTKKVYLFYRFWPLPLDQFGKNWKSFLRKFNSKNLSMGLANTLMGYECLILVLFLHQNKAAFGTNHLLLLFFILSPLLIAGYEWARLFYFDFKKLELGYYGYFKQRFQNQVEQFALGWGALNSLLVIGFGYFLGDKTFANQLWWMLPFFMVNSLLAYEQVKAFSENNYSLLIQSGLIFLGGVFILWYFPATFQLQAFYLSLVALGALWQLKRMEEKAGFSRFFSMLSLTEWLRQLKTVDQKVRIGYVAFSQDIDFFKLNALANKIRQRLTHGDELCLYLPNKIFWFEKNRENITKEEVIHRVEGLCDDVQITSFYSNGRVALQQSFLKEEVCDVSLEGSSVPSVDAKSLQETFEKMIANGFTFNPNSNDESKVNSLSAQQKRQILFEALSFSKTLTFSTKTNSPFEITVFCRNGEMELIFIVPKSQTQRGLRQKWFQFIRAVNLQEFFVNSSPQVNL